MSSGQKLFEINSAFRKGQSETLFFEEVIPLFCPGNNLYVKFNSVLKEAFTSAFSEGGAEPDECEIRWHGIQSIIVTGMNSGARLSEIEVKLLTFYKQFLKPNRTEINQNARANRCFGAIKNYLVGDVVMDFGCGKGLLGALIHTELKKRTILVDNIDFNKSPLPLLLSDRNGKTPLENASIDTSIAYLVLHHMDDPFAGIKELARVTKQRLILMEGYIEDENLLYINRAIDWFFNRILLGVDMNVPLNFLKLDQWECLLGEVGFKTKQVTYLGADEKLAPEHHVLIIADRI